MRKDAHRNKWSFTIKTIPIKQKERQIERERERCYVTEPSRSQKNREAYGEPKTEPQAFLEKKKQQTGGGVCKTV